MFFFAQADLGQLPPTFLKQVVLLAVGGSVAAAFVTAAIFAGLSYLLERRRDRREELRAANPEPTEISPNPLPVQKVFPNATLRDLNEKHEEHQRRLNGHDIEITNIWNTMRAEDKEIRKDVSDKFEVISRALGRIEGKLEE